MAERYPGSPVDADDIHPIMAEVGLIGPLGRTLVDKAMIDAGTLIKAAEAEMVAEADITGALGRLIDLVAIGALYEAHILPIPDSIKAGGLDVTS